MGNHWTPKYTKEQKAAIVEAAMTFGWTAPQIVRAAAAGQLPGRGAELEAFHMALGSARHYITEARRVERMKVQQAAEPQTALHLHVGRMIAVLDHEMRKMEQASRQGKLHPERLRGFARAARDIDQLAQQLTRGTSSPTIPATGEASKREPDFLDQLAHDARRDRKTEAFLRRHKAAPNPLSQPAGDGGDQETGPEPTDTMAPGEQPAV